MGTVLRKGNRTFVVDAVFYYRVECYRCGGLSIAGLSPEEAVEIACENGWREMHDGKMICQLCDLGVGYEDSRGAAFLGQER